MRLSILAYLLLLAPAPAFAAASEITTPAGVDCTGVASVAKTFGDTQWNALGCKDGKTLLVIAAQGNPGFPFYFTVFQRNGVYHVTGEGTGSKQVTDAAYEALSELSDAQIQTIIKESLAAPAPAPSPVKACTDVLPVTAANMAGTWLSVDDEPNLILIHYSADGSFSGKLMQDKKIMWLFGGTWKLEGTKYTETYTFSSLDRIPKGTTDSDEISAIGCGVMVYKTDTGTLKRYRKIKD
jgi:hypothetical protein